MRFEPKVHVALVACSLLAATAASAADPSIGVMDLRPASPADAKLARALGPALVEGIEAQHRGRVIGFAEVRDMLDATAAAALAGCVDDRCTVDAARALSVDLIVAGKIGRVGDSVLLSLSLLEPKTASVKARTSLAMASSGDLLPFAKRSATALLHPEAARSGDQIFADLRTALLIEGQDEQGRVVPGGGIDACVKERLLAAEVPLVAPRQVQRIRASFDREILKQGGDPLDVLTDEHADVVLSGMVVYAQQGQKGSVKSWRADLDLQVVKVDSGEIVAAHHGEAIALGVTPAGASRAAAKKLCADVVPALEKALAARYERGVRLQVNVDGVADAAAAEAVAEELRKLGSLVVRARVRRSASGTAVLETITRGIDGVRLALELGKASPGLRVLEAGPAVLRLTTAR